VNSGFAMLKQSRLGMWLVLLALALRIVVAPGFMPVVSGNGLTISMCTGQGAVTVHVPGAPDAPMQTECAYAALASMATHELPAVLAAPKLPVQVAAKIIAYQRAPHIGIPAPPPPAIGPPLA
jgi:hypothetical protein